MGIIKVQTVKGFTEVDGEAVLMDNTNTILARKTKNNSVFVQTRVTAAQSILEMIDEIIIWCAKNDKSFRRVTSISSLFSKASADKILAGDAKLAQELGLDIPQEHIDVINKIPEVKASIIEAIMGGAPVLPAEEVVNNLALNNGVSERELERLTEWRNGAGVREQHWVNTIASKMYNGSARRLLRYKPPSAGKTNGGQVHSSGDYGMPERYAKQIALKAKEVWDRETGAANTVCLYSGYINSRNYNIFHNRVEISCQSFPREEVEWLIEKMDWTN